VVNVIEDIEVSQFAVRTRGVDDVFLEQQETGKAVRNDLLVDSGFAEKAVGSITG
jgi:hypothetical protein